MGVTEWCWTDYPEPQPPEWSGSLEMCGWIPDDGLCGPVRPDRFAQSEPDLPAEPPNQPESTGIRRYRGSRLSQEGRKGEG